MSQDPYSYGQHPPQQPSPPAGSEDPTTPLSPPPPAGSEDPTTPLSGLSGSSGAAPAGPQAPGYGQPGYWPPASPGYHPQPGYGPPDSAPGAPGVTGAQWPGPPGPPPPKRRTGLVVGLVAGVLVLLLCLGAVGFVAVRTLSGDEGDETPPVTAPSDDATPRETPEPADRDPFAGSPAADFAVGEDGIVLPEAEAVGDFSRREVADALVAVREALIALRIDQRMLFEHDPEPFLELVAPDNADYLKEAFDSGSFGYFATQIADHATLVEPAPRVHGEISFEATTDEQGIRVIEVVTSFLWAYAFEPPSEDLDGIVVVRDELVWQIPHSDDVLDSSQGLWLWNGESYAWGIDCDAFAQSLLAPQSRPGRGIDGPDQDDIFDLDSGLDYPDTC